VVSIWGCLAALDEPGYLETRRAFISGEVDRLHESMNNIPGIIAYPSDGNFVLADISGTGREVRYLVDALYEKRILVRAMSAHGLPGPHIRVTAGTVEQNDRFLTLLEQLTAP
jgi:histidinol-phosphate/aromatic aminotransferase/cobyric acid decarboxylase-like protein